MRIAKNLGCSAAVFLWTVVPGAWYLFLTEVYELSKDPNWGWLVLSNAWTGVPLGALLVLFSAPFIARRPSDFWEWLKHKLWLASLVIGIALVVDAKVFWLDFAVVASSSAFLHLMLWFFSTFELSIPRSYPTPEHLKNDGFPRKEDRL